MITTILLHFQPALPPSTAITTLEHDKPYTRYIHSRDALVIAMSYSRQQKKASSGSSRNSNTPSKSSGTGRNVMDVAKEVAPNAAAFLAEALQAEDSEEEDYENDFDLQDVSEITKPQDSPLSLPSSMMSDEGSDLPTYDPYIQSKRSSMNAPVPSTYDPNVDNLANAEEQCRRLAHEKEFTNDLQRARARYRNDMNSFAPSRRPRWRPFEASKHNRGRATRVKRPCSCR